VRQIQCILLLDHDRTPPSPRFPYTTLFRSARGRHLRDAVLHRRRDEVRADQPIGAGPADVEAAGEQPEVSRAESPAEGRETSGGSEEHTSELQSPCNLVCRLLLEKKMTSGS